jgi:hypothetical protein
MNIEKFDGRAWRCPHVEITENIVSDFLMKVTDVLTHPRVLGVALQTGRFCDLGSKLRAKSLTSSRNF